MEADSEYKKTEDTDVSILVGNDGLSFPETMDAKVWAKEWLRTIQKHPDVPHDEGTMSTWFANAIMRGYDRATKDYDAKEAIAMFSKRVL